MTQARATDPHEQDFSDPQVRRAVNTVFGALMLGLLLSALDQTVVSTALPTIVGELGGLQHLSWVVTAYILATTVVTPVYGKLGDIFGHKLMLQISIAVFIAGSLACGLAQDMVQLIVFRALQGIGGGGLMIVTMAVIADLVPMRQRARYQGIVGSIFGLSTIVGPLLGGLFVEHLTWRWIFYINLPLGLLAVTVISLVFKTPPRVPGKPSIDYAGAVLLGSALTALVLVSSLGGSTLPWDSTPLRGLAIGALAAAALFVWVEGRARNPILPLSLFTNRTVSVALGIGLVVGMALMGSVTYLPLYLQLVKGLSPSFSGVVITPMMAGMITSSMLAGRRISRTGHYRIFPIIGTALATLGMAGLAIIPSKAPLGFTVAGVVVMGAGLGMVMQIIVLAIQNALPRTQLGVGTASASLVRSIGGSVGVSAFGALLNAQLAAKMAASAGPGHPAFNLALLAQLPPDLKARAKDAFSDALHMVFAGAAGLLILAFLLALLLRETPLRAPDPAATPIPMD